MKFKEKENYFNFYISNEDLNLLVEQKVLGSDNFELSYSSELDFGENKFYTKVDSLFVIDAKGLNKLINEGKVLGKNDLEKGLAIFTPKVHKNDYSLLDVSEQ